MARSFNGTSDHITLDPTPLPSGANPRTIVGWFKNNGTAAANQSFFSYGTSVNGERVSLSVDSGEFSVAISGHRWGIASPSLPTGWFMPALVFPTGASTSDQFLLYLDGVLQSSVTLGGAPRAVNTVNSFAHIGSNDDFSGFQKGSIAEIMVWNIDLTVGELLSLRRGSIPRGMRPANFALYLPLWGLTSPEVDLSGNRNSGTLVGTTSTTHAPVTTFTRKRPALFLSGVSAPTFRRTIYNRAGSRGVNR